MKLRLDCWRLFVFDVEDVAGAAGGEAEGVEEDLAGHTEDDQLVVEVLLPALSDLARPGAATLVVGPVTPADPHHLLVLRVLL